MGLFSGLFGNKKKTFFSPEWGEFTLVFSNGGNRIWSTQKDGVSYSVRGTNEIPDAEQLLFLKEVQNATNQLEEQITSRLTETLIEERETADFTNWRQRFKITSIQIVNVSKSKDWNMFVRDTKKPYTDFTLFIEDGNLIHLTRDS